MNTGEGGRGTEGQRERERKRERKREREREKTICYNIIHNVAYAYESLSFIALYCNLA